MDLPKVPPVQSLLDFGGRAVLVTGAGGGILAGIAERFAQAGAAVAVHYHSNPAPAEQLAAQIRGGAAGRSRCRPISATSMRWPSASSRQPRS